ncbi:MAG: hypothetical protein FWD69_10470 [Polyangiaceae bacterium]|nr:hypothetical protein [Polyangiaceae bacterium]
MDPELVKRALDVVEKGDAQGALDILKTLIASAAGADPEPEGDESGSEGDGAEGAPAEGSLDNAETPPEEQPKKAAAAARKAMDAMLQRLTGAKTLAEVLVRVSEYRASHLTLESERQKLAKERATLEAAERRKLCVELVTLGAEFPATVWADDKATRLKPRWEKMGIEELRTHVADQKAARPKAPSAANGIRPPITANEVVDLSADELKICEELKCEPKVFAALKKFRDGVSHG